MNATGIIFANQGSMSSLTMQRTMASLPFGGRYRQVDFALSNLSCAGIHHIGIITRNYYQSLLNHVGSGEEWGLEMGEGGLEYLTPFSSSATSEYRGKLESMHSAIGFLEWGDENDYLVMIDAAIVCNIDIKKVIDAHEESGADITLVTKAGVADGRKKLDLAVKVDDKGQIVDMVVDYTPDESYLASMDIFVMNRKWMVQQVKEHIARNLYHMDRDLVMGLWQKGQATINVYPFDGIAMYNETVEEYFANSLALTKQEVRKDLFGGNHLVFTKVRDRVPTYYGEDCQVDNCSVADGCMLEGHVQDSVLFRQVTVAQGAHLDHCVVMNDAVIGENCQLKYVILDKDVVVRPGSQLTGTPTNPVIIPRGEVV